MSLTQGVTPLRLPADPARPVTEWLLERIPLGPGVRVLEIASGSGTVTLAAAAREPEGIYVCTDLHARGLLEAVAQRGLFAAAPDHRRGNAPHIAFTVADMQRLPFSGGVFDAAVCRLGFMYASDPAEALGEARRVLRSGGTLAFAVWAAPDENPWQSHLDDALTTSGVEDRSGAWQTGGMFGLSDAATLRRKLDDVGFSAITMTTVDLPRRYNDFAEYWSREVNVGTERSARLQALTTKALTTFRERLEAALRPYREKGGYHIPGRCLVAAALA